MTVPPFTRRRLLVGGAAAASALAAVRFAGSIPIAEAQAARRYKIALVAKSLDNPVFAPANVGGQARAAELGDVDFTFTGPPQADAAQQVTAVDGLIAAGYDAIGISCCSAQSLRAPIDRAVAKGIKVMTWDSDSPKSKRAAYYGVDNFKGGQLQATLLNDLLRGKKGDVWLLSGLPSAANLQARVRGVQSVLSRDLNISGMSFCNDDIALGVSQVENVLQTQPNLIGYIMIGAWPLFGSPDALPTLRSKTHLGLQVVAFDALAAELPYIADGTVKASIGQDYWGWGYQSVQILRSLLQGGHYKPFVPQGLPVITTANVADYEQQWAASKTADGMATTFREPPILP